MQVDKRTHATHSLTHTHTRTHTHTHTPHTFPGFSPHPSHANECVQSPDPEKKPEPPKNDRASWAGLRR